MSKTFDISSFAKTLQTANVPDSGTGPEQITYIDINLLDADPGNFYSLEGVEPTSSSAASSSLSGYDLERMAITRWSPATGAGRR